MSILLAILLTIFTDPGDLSRINGMKRAAEKSFLEGNYADAASRYRMLLDSMSVDEDEILLNLAHSYHQLSDSSNARSYYAQASMSSDPRIKSIAYQQLGVMAKSPQTLKQSLQYMKAAVKADPSNMDARYDYEVVKKWLEEQEKNQQNQDQQNQENKDQNEEEQQDQQNQNQQDQDKQNQDNQDKQDQENQNEQDQEQEQQKPDEQEEKEGEQEQESKEGDEQEKQEQQNLKEKLEEMNISEEKAQMILEAMRNSEIQYIQQQKRKAKERPPSNKPDW